MYDIIIIGAGIAGMTSAIYARRANKKVLVLEGKAYGGQVIETTKIENYPANPHITGLELAKNTYEQMKGFEPDFKYEKVLSVQKNENDFIVTTDSDKYETRAIIVATGTNYKRMGIPEENDLIGHGISYCATCDGQLYKDKEIAVIGGGNTALYSTLYLSDIASKVTLIHRRNEFRGDEALVSKVKERGNVEFEMGKVISSLNAKDGVLSSIILKDVDSDETIKKNVSALFVEIGREPDNSIVKDLVELNEDGYIKADETGVTSCPGIFAAGDCRVKTLRQIVTAASDGASAASSAIEFLNAK